MFSAVGRRSALVGLVVLLISAVTFVAASRTSAASTVDIVILGGESAVSASVAAELETCTTGSVSRLAGADRYITAAAISEATFASADGAYVATGVNFPDALAGGPPAAMNAQPVLLVSDPVPASTLTELGRLGVSSITVLGGSGVVPDSVVASLNAVAPTTRLWGANRYATAAAIVAAEFASADTVYVATGLNFPDALAGVSAAAGDSAPILLVQQNSIPTETAAQLDRLNPTTIKILGGTGVVSAGVASTLSGYASTVVRLSGPDRYSTAVAISEHAFPSGASTIYIATGVNYPDALAGGPAAGANNAPILLVQPDAIPGSTKAEVERITGMVCGSTPPTTTTTTVPGTGDTVHVGFALLPGTTDSLLVDIGGVYVVDATVLGQGGSATVTTGPSVADLFIGVSAPLSAPPGSSESVIEATSCYEATNPCPSGSQHEVVARVDVTIGEPGVDIPDEIFVPTDERWVTDSDGFGTVPGELALLATNGSTMADVVALVEANGGVVVGADESAGMYQLRFNSEGAAAAARAVLEVSTLVEAVGPYREHPDVLNKVPTDWTDDGPEGKWTFNVTGAPGAWDRETGSPNVHVGVVDQGIYYLHEDLYGNFGSYTRGEGSTYANWADDISHGTHVAGTICAEQNGIGLVGVMWDCKIDALDLRKTKYDAFVYRSKIESWLDRHPEVKIVNISWSFGAHREDPGGSCTEPPTKLEKTAMLMLMVAHPDVLFVVSAGNCGEMYHTPALDVSASTPANWAGLLPNVVSVGSHDRDGGRSIFSSTGAEVSAPGGFYSGDAGSSVWSTTHTCDSSGGCSSTYDDEPGTSMAAPFISGVAGLMLSRRPSLSAAAIAACITGPGSPFSVPGDPGVTAIGVEQALDCAETVADAVGFIAGTVTAEGSGMQLAGVTVSTNPGGGTATVSDTTSASGDYVLSDLKPGSYTVNFTPPTGPYRPRSVGGVVVTGGEMTIVDVQLESVERNALVALYNSTDGPNWTRRTHWLTGTDHCGWQGVSCNSDGLVEELYLSFNSLSGPIPAALGNLTNLVRLHLDHNALSGTIPPELGNLTNLTSLNLGSNLLTGAIPPELGNLSDLVLLGLGNDWLSNNKLTGAIPPELGNLWNLTTLDLNGNLLSGAIPPELGNLQNLEWLTLSKNSLSATIPPELGNLSSLTELDLFENSLSGSIPSELGQLSALTRLALGDNSLTGSLPAELANLGNLTDLYLQHNSLTGPIPAWLGDMSNLDGLYLADNLFSGSIPAELGNLTNLRSLWLSSNPLTGSIPAELGNLTQLWNLGLSRNSLTGPIPPELGNLTSILEIDLGSNSLTGSIPPELGQLSTLGWLWLNNNSLTGPIPPELGNLTSLLGVSLYENSLSGSIPPELGQLSDLEELTLGRNSLSGSIPPELGSYSNLYYLDLSHNELSGPVPPELMNLPDPDPIHGLDLTVSLSWQTGCLTASDPVLVAWLEYYDPHWNDGCPAP